MKKARYLLPAIQALALDRDKMAFISGPRQTGKTTLAKHLQKHYDHSQYKNWDETQFRRLWLKNPNQLASHFDLSKTNESRLLVLDEIHKAKGCKQKIKGLYDHFNEQLHFIVTGSARLNVFQKGGDSLMGRYIHFRLYPFSYGELFSEAILAPESWKKKLFSKAELKTSQKTLDDLLKLSGFPDPYFSKNEKIHRVWQKDRIDKVIREDLRDLSRLPELSQVEMLVSLLPSKVGNPLSVQSLREDLEVAHDTVSRWLRYLNTLYYYFEIRPWTKSVVRSLKREPKIYLYDWTEVESVGFRFENLIAVHLLKACHYWTDTGEGFFDLHYLRNKEKMEIDFLITKDKLPWLAIEAKHRDKSIDYQKTEKLISALNCSFVQVVFEENCYLKYKNFSNASSCALMSATRFLSGLP